MEGTFAVQQWIQQAINNNIHHSDAILESPPGIDEGVWKYEVKFNVSLQKNIPHLF
jgi:hypothetical protein